MKARLVEVREVAEADPVLGSPSMRMYTLDPPLWGRFPAAVVYVWLDGPSMAMAATSTSGEFVAGQFWTGEDGTASSALAKIGYEIEEEEEP